MYFNNKTEQTLGEKTLTREELYYILLFKTMWPYCIVRSITGLGIYFQKRKAKNFNTIYPHYLKSEGVNMFCIIYSFCLAILYHTVRY